jgi:hypothetical protein
MTGSVTRAPVRRPGGGQATARFRLAGPTLAIAGHR